MRYRYNFAREKGMLTAAALSPWLLLLFAGSADCSCCVHGTTSSLAGLSCRDVLFWSPACFGASGEYWLHNSTSGAEQLVWCDMETAGGGWEKALDFQASTTVPVCPFSLSAHPHNGSFLCSNGGAVVEGTVSRAASESFSEIRGSLSAFADGDFSGFLPNPSMGQNRDMEGHFLDGVVVMLREEESTHLRHIHSFVLGDYENIDDVFLKTSTCPGFGGASPNSVIGQHYSCALVKSGNRLSGTQPLPVWETSPAHCGGNQGNQGLCARPSDWFHRRLARQYKSDSTEIVLRFMSRSPAHIALSHLTLYVR